MIDNRWGLDWREGQMKDCGYLTNRSDVGGIAAISKKGLVVRKKGREKRERRRHGKEPTQLRPPG